MARLELICGPMFSGKSEELIRRIKRAKLAKQTVATFKSNLDGRYSKSDIVSHDKRSFQSKPIASLAEIKDCSANFIAVDEIQFFPAEEMEILNDLANQGKTVIAAGLDLDFEAKPFEATSYVFALAERVLKLKSICMVCGDDASYSKRLNATKEKILVGEKKAYEPRCRKHFF